MLRLRESVGIVETVTPYASPKQAGRDFVCLCPFHSEKTPSFHIYTATNSFYCFGCGVGGDNITFIRLAENLDYIEAVRFLAQKAGLVVPESDVSEPVLENRLKVLEINRCAARFFRDMLLSSRVALDYLYNRGLTNNIIKKFGIGYAPDGWSALKSYLYSKGYSEVELINAGLISQGQNGNTYDKFRGRVIFPVIDRRGNVIAFGGRVLKPDASPKYLNSPETVVFQKRANLFALNFAKNTKEKYIILCEGNMDVVALYQAGFDNAVATLGTAVTGEQARLLKNYCERVIIAYDSDDAGQKATVKANNLLSQAGLNTKVLQFEGAKDPDEFLMKYGRESFLRLLENSRSAISFELLKIQNSQELETPDGRAEYLKKAIALLAQIDNNLERVVYISEVAKIAGVSSSDIQLSVEQKLKHNKRKESYNERKTLIRAVDNPTKMSPDEARLKRETNAERSIIAYLFHSPEFLPLILKQISPCDFPGEFNRNLFEKMVIRLKKQQSIDIAALGGEFSVKDVGRIERIKRDGNQLLYTKERLQDCINTLLNFKHQKNPAEMSMDELLKYNEERRARLTVDSG